MSANVVVYSARWSSMSLTALMSDDCEDDYFEGGDLFSRLEEIRDHLEKELGLDMLKKAYEAVQVLMGLVL